MTDKVISWSEWEEAYKPIVNPDNGDNENLWDGLFDFQNQIQDLPSGYHLWTLVDNNPNSVYLDILPGNRIVNRLGFFVTEVPWTDSDMVVSNDPSYS